MKLKTPLLLVFLFLIFACQGCKDNAEFGAKNTTAVETPQTIKEKWHWDDPNQQSESAGYAQVVKMGSTLYISGIPANDISPEGITNLYENLGRCLNAYGATFNDVVKETLYTTDIEAIKANNEVRKKFYNGDYPAATWVQISRLYEPTAKIEVDLIAEIAN